MNKNDFICLIYAYEINLKRHSKKKRVEKIVKKEKTSNFISIIIYIKPRNNRFHKKIIYS